MTRVYICANVDFYGSVLLYGAVKLFDNVGLQAPALSRCGLMVPGLFTDSPMQVCPAIHRSIYTSCRFIATVNIDSFYKLLVCIPT